MGWDAHRPECLSPLDATHLHLGDERGLGGSLACPARVEGCRRADRTSAEQPAGTQGHWQLVTSGSCKLPHEQPQGCFFNVMLVTKQLQQVPSWEEQLEESCCWLLDSPYRGNTSCCSFRAEFSSANFNCPEVRHKA